MLRIVPAYWVALTVLAIFPGIVGVFSGDWWRYYFFLQLYSYETLGRGIPVAWSLCVEVTYYALLPFWAMAVARVSVGSGPRAWLWAELAFLGLAAAVGIASRWRGHATSCPTWWPRACSVNPPGSRSAWRWPWPAWRWREGEATRAGHAVIGTPRHLLGRLRGRPARPCAAAAGGALSASCRRSRWSSRSARRSRRSRYGALAALLVLPAVFGERAEWVPRRVLAAAPTAWLGLVSYGLFLWHLAVAELGLRSDPQHFSASGLDLATKIDRATTPILFVLALTSTAGGGQLLPRGAALPAAQGDALRFGLGRAPGGDEVTLTGTRVVWILGGPGTGAPGFSSCSCRFRSHSQESRSGFKPGIS